MTTPPTGPAPAPRYSGAGLQAHLHRGVVRIGHHVIPAASLPVRTIPRTERPTLTVTRKDTTP